MDFLYVLVTLCLKKSVFCLNSQGSLFPEPFPFSVLGQTTRLLMRLLAGAAFFPPSLLKGGSPVPAKYWQPLPQLPGAGATQTLKLGVGMSEFRCLCCKEKHVQALCSALGFIFCYVKLSGGLPELGRVEETTFSVKRSAALRQIAATC